MIVANPAAVARVSIAWASDGEDRVAELGHQQADRAARLGARAPRRAVAHGALDALARLGTDGRRAARDPRGGRDTNSGAVCDVSKACHLFHPGGSSKHAEMPDSTQSYIRFSRLTRLHLAVFFQSFHDLETPYIAGDVAGSPHRASGLGVPDEGGRRDEARPVASACARRRRLGPRRRLDRRDGLRQDAGDHHDHVLVDDERRGERDPQGADLEVRGAEQRSSRSTSALSRSISARTSSAPRPRRVRRPTSCGRRSPTSPTGRRGAS